jgi:hypothetical protein
MYLPDYVLNDPNFNQYGVEVFRLYNNENLLNLFPRAGRTDDSILEGSGFRFSPPWCIRQSIPNGCQLNGDDAQNRACQVSQWGNCIELLFQIDSWVCTK